MHQKRNNVLGPRIAQVLQIRPNGFTLNESLHSHGCRQTFLQIHCSFHIFNQKKLAFEVQHLINEHSTPNHFLHLTKNKNYCSVLVKLSYFEIGSFSGDIRGRLAGCLQLSERLPNELLKSSSDRSLELEKCG